MSESMNELNFVDIGSRKKFDSAKMKKNSVFDTPHFFMDVYCFEPGQEQKPHSHEDADKVYYVLEGEGDFLVGDEHRTLGAGNAVLAPSGVDHGVANATESRLTLLVFMSPNPNR
jgi:quercetin dioxygenase-like cupin family protein